MDNTNVKKRHLFSRERKKAAYEIILQQKRRVGAKSAIKLAIIDNAPA